MKKLGMLAALAPALTLMQGCSAFDHIGKPPSMTAPGDARAAIAAPSPARLAVGAPEIAPYESATTGSLWRSGPESLFGDRRARGPGDIVTVLIEIDESAEIRNRTKRARSADQGISVPALLGAPGLIADALPDGAGLDPAVDAASSSSSSGDGTIQREERIMLRIAATVTGMLPNGHLAIAGSQEVRVNYELRDLQVAGIIRPEDISRANVITYDKIAEARISYGGRGQLTDIQKAPYGQQIIDLISPF